MENGRKKVHIKISGVQKSVSDEVTVQEYEGVYTVKGDSRYLQYEEITEQGSNSCLLKIVPDTVMLRKSGSLEANLLYRTGSSFTNAYNTPYGVFEMETSTRRILLVDTDEGFYASVEYDVIINGTEIKDCMLTIQVCH